MSFCYMCAFKVQIWQKNHRIVGQYFFNMYFEVLSEIRFRKHPSQSSLYFNGAEYFYHQSWSSNYLFLRVCVCVICVICFVWLMGQYWPFSVNKNYYYFNDQSYTTQPLNSLKYFNCISDDSQWYRTVIHAEVITMILLRLDLTTWCISYEGQ